ncbi:MAG: VOC family protein [Pseudomonadota bacterium]
MTQVNWFEIPAQDVGRAVEFYGTVLGEPLGEMDGPDGQMHVFMGADGPAGQLAQGEPVAGGVTIYLDCADIDAALGRVEAAGGAVVQTRTSIGPFGFVGQFTDSEGNTVALHTGL